MVDKAELQVEWIEKEQKYLLTDVKRGLFSRQSQPKQGPQQANTYDPEAGGQEESLRSFLSKEDIERHQWADRLAFIFFI